MLLSARRTKHDGAFAYSLPRRICQVQLTECRIPGKQGLWRVVLNDPACLEEQHTVKCMDECEAMEDRDDGMILEFRLNDLVHSGLSLPINTEMAIS